MKSSRSVSVLTTLGLLCLAVCDMHAAERGVAHFEGRQTHPLAWTPSGRLLLAVNTTDARLSVFDVTVASNAAPVLVAEIPVGLEPVAVRARTEDEAWVVNEVSDSVSVVSLSRQAVVATLPCADEPADVVFAGDRAFVSCARNGVIRVFDVVNRAEVGSVALRGDQPRALAVGPDGASVLAAFLYSGNATTVLPPAAAAPQPAPENPSLPEAPVTAEIVDASDPRVRYTVLDHDVAVISTSSLQVERYLSGLGTVLLDLALRTGPEGPELWVAGTEAHNRIRFEPELRGRVAENRLSRVRLPAGTPAALDLNAGSAGGTETALAQPAALVFSGGGSTGWVAAFGSDRIARFRPDTGIVDARVDLRSHTGWGGISDPSRVRGPRGLALDASGTRLYVLNRLADTLSVVATGSATVVSEVPLGSSDPLPAAAREGRGVLFDARLSGNGTASCATCHVDADRDGLAWDLGNPSGEMMTVTGANLSVHDSTPRERRLHPMKGPMTTQTLRGLALHQPMHWRGDRAHLDEFNVTFPDLLGGALRPPAEFEALGSYLAGLRLHPNPHRLPDGSLPARLGEADPVRGRLLFNLHINHCAVCHVLPAGTDHNLDDPRNFGGRQPMKTPSLRTTHHRAAFDPSPGGESVSGFGLGHDGASGLRSLPTTHFYELDVLTGADFADVTAFVLSFDTGTAPSVGRSRTVTPESAGLPETTADLALLETQAARPEGCDLVARGTVAGQPRQWLFDPATRRYLPDSAASGAADWTRQQVLEALAPGDALTFLGVLPGEGIRFGRDRNGNGVPDADEPPPRLVAELVSGVLNVRWSADTGWLLEQSADPGGPWRPSQQPLTGIPPNRRLEAPVTDGEPAFFRLRRIW